MKYTKVQEEFLAFNAPMMTRRDLTHDFNLAFNDNKTVSVINAKCFRMGLKSLYTNTKTHPARQRNYHFKKGCAINDKRPIGGENKSKGFIRVKVAHPGVWRFKHHVVWEQHHGKIPKNCVIRFLDGDTTNCEINNLVLVKRSENAVINSDKTNLRKLIVNKASHETVINIAKLKILINERKPKC